LLTYLGGGMSRVYKARDTLIGRDVAVKVLTEAASFDESTKARFIREAQLAGNVNHYNIVRVYDFGEDNGRLFMVMEFLDGEDLSEVIKNGRGGTLENRIDIAAQVANAVEHVHSLNIVHRDLKPHNIFVTRGGIAKLMDFGIAKTEQTSMTKTGFTLGTPNYMPPEQVLGKNVNHLSDVYAFGILFYELLSGTRPFAGDTVDRLFYQILNDPVDVTPLRNARVPDALIGLISECTDKDPAQRPQSFALIRSRLAAMLAGAAAPAAAPPPEPQRASSRKWLLPVAGVALVAAAVAGYFALRPSPQPPVTPATPAGESRPPAPPGMVLVPAGTFPFGPDGQPRETREFYIDRAEVTRAAYKGFLDATGHAAPRDFQPADDAVGDITIADARAYAQWAGKRLPAPLEWEKAARSAASLGVDRMEGGVWEFVEQTATPSRQALEYYAALLTPKPTAAEPWCMIRGSSDFDRTIPVYEFATVPERFHKADIGFRCVRDAR
jgi:eukaryotic-like serine/threonine-protein kinase